MAKASEDHLQGNMHDKIFRENMEAALPGIIEHLLGLYIVHSIELPDDIQHTKEGKPDLLKKVTDKTGKTFVLHIEWLKTIRKWLTGWLNTVLCYGENTNYS